MFLVRADATLPDGTRLAAFLTPASIRNDIATMQPYVFVGGVAVGFWGGMIGVRTAIREWFEATAGSRPFPVTVVADKRFAVGEVSLVVPGWLPRIADSPLVSQLSPFR